MKPGCTLIGKIYGKPEKRDELLKILNAFVAPTRAEAGCLEYQFHVCDDDPNAFMFYENWNSRKDLEDHLKMPHLLPLIERKEELLAKEIELQFFSMVSDYLV